MAGGRGAGAVIGDVLPVSRGNALPASMPIRIVHPDNGVFDIVVSQAFDTIPEAAGVLRGRPIYMVYLKVGTPKDWLLQYCTTDPAVRSSGSVVTLGNPAPLKAPYPRVTLVPPASLLPTASRVILHGFLDVNGILQQLSAVAKEDAQIEFGLRPYLKQWEFRPATRDGRPIQVELLLVIPSR